MFQKPLLSASLSLSLVLLTSADITWPLYSQQCRDDAGPPFLDDEETFGPGGKYHDGSAAYPQLLEDGSCAKPLQGACASRDDKKTAYLEGPIDCGNKGWYCRIYNDEENGWANINLVGDYNFGNCNSTSSFEDAGYDRDGHCHGSSVDNTYYWWIRDHWHRQYNGRVRCCCGWSEGGTQPLFSGRIANRCDYRRLVTETENLDECRDANEGHNLGFDDTNLGVDDIGCKAIYQSSQLNNPIPEDDDVCWEIQRFGYTEESTLIRVAQLEISYIFYLYVLVEDSMKLSLTPDDDVTEIERMKRESAKTKVQQQNNEILKEISLNRKNPISDNV